MLLQTLRASQERCLMAGTSAEAVTCSGIGAVPIITAFAERTEPTQTSRQASCSSRIASTPWGWRRRSWRAALAGMLPEALALFACDLRDHPRSGQAAAAGAGACLKAGDRAHAKRHFELALSFAIPRQGGMNIRTRLTLQSATPTGRWEDAKGGNSRPPHTPSRAADSISFLRRTRRSETRYCSPVTPAGIPASARLTFDSGCWGNRASYRSSSDRKRSTLLSTPW